MLFQIQSYIKFLWHSKNEHAVHSPFVFSLLTKCFYDKRSKPEYAILKKYRKTLLENKNFIEVTDFGAGSRVFKSNRRQISKIAQTAGISPKRAELLLRVSNYFKPKSVLEIGTSLGLASSAIALGSKESFLLSLEGCQNTQSVAENLFNQQFSDFNFDFVNSEFSKFLKDGSANICDWDLIYFDGNHSKKATLQYFELLLPTINNDSVWIFDDIHWSEDMEEAWEIIKNHPKVKVTIDTFQWGFVFFRREQPKEHFIIRA